MSEDAPQYAVDVASPLQADITVILRQIATYWQALGLTDPLLISSLAEDCLTRARRRVGRVSNDELLRRSLEEAQRRFDHALANAVGLPPSNDPHPIAAARAALLLAARDASLNCLFAHDESTRELGAALQEVLPQATPPESHLTMRVKPLRFWLFASTDT
ncbi:MAG: hypothetical protein ACK443_11810 [Methylococcaceae bacterium]|jgi:hypothetical protein